MAARSLYRILLKSCQSFPDHKLLLQRDLRGTPPRIFKNETYESPIEILNLLDCWMAQDEKLIMRPTDDPSDVPQVDTFWTTKDSLRHAVRDAFITTAASSNSTATAIHAYRYLQAMSSLSMSISTEHGITVVATSSVGKERWSDYRMRVENNSTDFVQLLGRTWIITQDELAPPVRVHEPQTGAVGHLPVLAPGQVFEYQSMAEGESMKGSFHLCRVREGTRSAIVGQNVKAFAQTDQHFQVSVNPFRLP